MQYFICDKCGKVFYIEKRKHIQIDRKKLMIDDWEKIQLLDCKKGEHQKVKNTLINNESRELKEWRIMRKNKSLYKGGFYCDKKN